MHTQRDACLLWCVGEEAHATAGDHKDVNALAAVLLQQLHRKKRLEPDLRTQKHAGLHARQAHTQAHAGVTFLMTPSTVFLVPDQKNMAE